MLAPLTLRLIAFPERGWPELVQACSTDDDLPAAPLHGGLVALASVVSTLIGAAFLPGATMSRVLVTTLAGFAGYVGAIILPAYVPPASIGVRAEDAALVPRFAASACLPLAACGIFNLAPLPVLSLLWTLAGVTLAACSAYIGADVLLRLEGEARHRAARTIAIAGSLPVVISTVLRWILAA